MLVLPLAVVHDAADGGPFSRRNFDEVLSRFGGDLESLVGGDDPDLLAVFADQPDG